jgi:acetyltransferase
LGGAVLSWAQEQGVGLSKFVSYGNAVDLSEIDFLDVLRDDDETKVVALYIETVSDGRAFMEAARRLSAVKPLIVIKSGRSESGSRATQSHTGSMAGLDAVYDAALRQCGAIRVSGIEEMFDLCRGFVHLPVLSGRRIAIVTNSGGPGVLAADAADAAGLQIKPPGTDLRVRLANRLPDFCSLSNPFDLTVQATEDDYRETLIETLSEYDGAIAINVNTPYLDVAPLARGVVAASQATGKPIATSFVAGEPAQAALPILKAGGVPNYVTGERCAHVLALMAELSGRHSEIENSLELPGSRQDTGELLPFPWTENPTEPMVLDWMDELGLPTIEHAFATSADEAVQAARRFGGPVAMKIVSPLVLHKTDVGGVILNLSALEDIDEAFARLQRLVPLGAFRGVLITPMLHHPVEAIVGLSTDSQFGPVIAVGLGGIHTEIFNDIALRVAPVSVGEAQRMIDSLKGVGLLKGARGSVLRDIASLAQLVSDVSRLPVRFDGIEELDLNPVFLLERGCMAADARLIPADRTVQQRSE